LVTTDNRLNFNEHINSVCMKASQRISVLMRLRKLIPTLAKLQLYKSAILPHLACCHLVWHVCTASDTRRLERVQELGLRAIFRDKQFNYQQLLDKADLPTLYNRRLHGEQGKSGARKKSRAQEKKTPPLAPRAAFRCCPKSKRLEQAMSSSPLF